MVSIVISEVIGHSLSKARNIIYFICNKLTSSGGAFFGDAGFAAAGFAAAAFALAERAPPVGLLLVCPMVVICCSRFYETNWEDLQLPSRSRRGICDEQEDLIPFFGFVCVEVLSGFDVADGSFPCRTWYCRPLSANYDRSRER